MAEDKKAFHYLVTSHTRIDRKNYIEISELWFALNHYQELIDGEEETFGKNVYTALRKIYQEMKRITKR
jgi:hypothetical protein